MHISKIFVIKTCATPGWERHAIALASAKLKHAILKTCMWYVTLLKHYMVGSSFARDSFIYYTLNYTFLLLHSLNILSVYVQLFIYFYSFL